MTYTVTMTSPAHRMLRKLPSQVRKHLVKQSQKLAENPQLGEQLKQALRPFRSLHTTYQGTHYRVVYEVSTKSKQIIVRGTGVRENLYQKLRQMQLKPLQV